MSRFNKGLSVLIVSILGLWGCAQGPANSTAQADRVKKLEEKCSKLEEDSRTARVNLEAEVKKTTGLKQDKAHLEEQRAGLQKEVEQLKLVVKERDRLRQELEVKTTQRDALQTRCDKLKAGIRNLMSDDDAMLNTPPTITTVTTNAGGN
jgi:chromosome segregation ATPase